MPELTWEQVQEKLTKLSPKYQKLCWLLSQGQSQVKASKEVGISQPRVSQLLNEPEYTDFQEAVDCLTRYLSRTGAAESLRLVRRAVVQFEDEDGSLDLSGTNLLQWARWEAQLEGTVEDTPLRVRVVDWEGPKSMADLLAGLENL